MPVVAVDGLSPGKVVDIWIDRSEYVIRYLEVQLEGGDRTVLLPMNYANFTPALREIRVVSVLAQHFAHVPILADPNRITFLEEDKIVAYFAGGYLYATAERLGPLL